MKCRRKHTVEEVPPAVSAFERVNQIPEPPAVVIVITDGWLDVPKQAPEYPVIWAMTPSRRCPGRPCEDRREMNNLMQSNGTAVIPSIGWFTGNIA